MHPHEQDSAAMQADAVVRALDVYLGMFPWPAPTVQTYVSSQGDRQIARDMLIKTLAATIRMSEPRKSPLQNS